MVTAYDLVLVSGPAIEPVSLAEAKLHLRVDDDQTAEDALILGLIRAAREQTEAQTRRALVTQTWDARYTAFPDDNGRLELPRAPLQSVASVAYLDSTGATTTLDPGDYMVDTASEPGAVVLAYGGAWPTPTLYPLAPVRVRFTAGYGEGAGDVPESIRAAMLLLVGHLYEHREAVVTASSASVGSLPLVQGVDALLWPYRVLR